jgi:hypothetical protein
MASINICCIGKCLLRDTSEPTAGSDGGTNRKEPLRIVIFATKSHTQIIKESGKIGHGIYASISAEDLS